MAKKGTISHRRKDLVGKKIGKLTVLNLSEKKSKRGEIYWDCQCDCGNKTTIIAKSLNGKNRTNSCGCLGRRHFIDYTGQTFHNIKVIKHLGKDKSKNNIYNFECHCGKIFTSQISDIKTNKIKSCGCLVNSKQINSYLEDPYRSSAYHIYAEYRCSAKTNNREFSIDFDDFRKLLESECYYCGVTSSNSHKKSKKIKNGPKEPYLYNGIDRIDNNIGYILNNCITSCRHCNISKHTLTQSYFIERAYMIVKRDKLRKKRNN